jgi:hypothetical protein
MRVLNGSQGCLLVGQLDRALRQPALDCLVDQQVQIHSTAVAVLLVVGVDNPVLALRELLSVLIAFTAP